VPLGNEEDPISAQKGKEEKKKLLFLFFCIVKSSPWRSCSRPEHLALHDQNRATSPYLVLRCHRSSCGWSLLQWGLGCRAEKAASTAMCSSNQAQSQRIYQV
jgi:hypothetical protein